MSENENENQNENEDEDAQSSIPDWLVGVLVIETIAVSIGLVTPIVPSKTGSDWSPADLFTADPTYLEKAFASFVVLHGIILVLGVVAWILMKRDRSA